jgi:hypothetical protein
MMLGTFAWNLLRIVLNWILAPFRTKNWAVRLLTSEVAEAIYSDMEAVKLAGEALNSNHEDKVKLVQTDN